jgi:hypothetical protein
VTQTVIRSYPRPAAVLHHHDDYQPRRLFRSSDRDAIVGRRVASFYLDGRDETLDIWFCETSAREHRRFFFTTMREGWDQHAPVEFKTFRDAVERCWRNLGWGDKP